MNLRSHRYSQNRNENIIGISPPASQSSKLVESKKMHIIILDYTN
jgi:hypothetical protein